MTPGEAQLLRELTRNYETLAARYSDLNDAVSGLEELVQDLKEQLAAPFTEAEVVGGRIPMTWVAYPGGKVGLDAVGNLTAVTMDDGYALSAVRDD